MFDVFDIVLVGNLEASRVHHRDKRHLPLHASLTYIAQLPEHFLVGAGAKVGSNAVVVRDVPAGATAVGNPARIIQRDDTAEQERRDFAEKIGFQAYGANPDLPDPVVEAIRHLLDHMRKADARMDRMCETLGRMSPGFCDEKPEALKPEDLEALQDGSGVTVGRTVSPPPSADADGRTEGGKPA